jgi:hypothetical protein
MSTVYQRTRLRDGREVGKHLKWIRVGRILRHQERIHGVCIIGHILHELGEGIGIGDRASIVRL